LLKKNINFNVTNEVGTANLIIGLKKHLQQNFKLISVAKQKGIPVYSFNQLSLYQINKLIQSLILY